MGKLGTVIAIVGSIAVSATAYALSLPLKLNAGHEVQNADVYTDLYIWANGTYRIGSHITTHKNSWDGSCVNITFTLLDANGMPILDQNNQPTGRFGMPADNKWCVGAAHNPLDQPHERYDNLDGQMDPTLLQKAEKVGILLAPKWKPISENLPGVIKTVKDALPWNGR